jgi:hypothetical protein
MFEPAANLPTDTNAPMPTTRSVRLPSAGARLRHALPFMVVLICLSSGTTAMAASRPLSRDEIAKLNGPVRASVQFNASPKSHPRGPALIHSSRPTDVIGVFDGPHGETSIGVAVGPGATLDLRDLRTAQMRSLRSVLTQLRDTHRESGNRQRARVRRSIADTRAAMRTLRRGELPALRQVGSFRKRSLQLAMQRGAEVAVVRRGPRRRPSPTPRRSPARSSQASLPSDQYVPRSVDAHTDLANTTLDGNPIPTLPPGPDGVLSEKRTWIGVSWGSEERLAWYRGDGVGERGVEIEGFPSPGTGEWSDDWSDGEPYGTTWASNLPSAYRDDLASDQYTGPGVSAFAIGSANAHALSTNQYYFVQYQTNHGVTDVGTVQVRISAVRHAAAEEVQNWGYCYTIGGWDAGSCFFTEASQHVGSYAVGHRGSWEIDEDGLTIGLVGASRHNSGPYTCGAGADYGIDLTYDVDTPTSGAGQTYTVRGPGWAALIPPSACYPSVDQRPWIDVTPQGMFEDEVSFYDYLSEGYGITRAYDGDDIVWTVAMPSPPIDWGSPFGPPWSISVGLGFRTIDPSFDPLRLPAPRLRLAP